MSLPQFSFSVPPTHPRPKDSDLFAAFRNGHVLMHQTNGAYRLPEWKEIKGNLPSSFTPFELAHTDDLCIWSPDPYHADELCETENEHFLPWHFFRELPYHQAGILMSCIHLWNWYQKNRFCSRCGQPVKADETERAIICSHCHQVIYPTIAPAVIVAITQGNKILLARNKRSTYQHYSLISGYVEVGETLEHAVRREVVEEVGLHLKSLRYLEDQPWGISGAQMFAFHAEAVGGEDIVLQEDELSEAGWFTREELPPPRPVISIALDLMERFRNHTL